MNYIQRLLNALDAGMWKFIRAVHSANHDYPYHDYKKFENSGEESAEFHYIVGEGNINVNGDQHKYFTAKRMLIYSIGESAFQLRLNHSNNVTIYPTYKALDFTTFVFYWEIELHTNISEVWLTVPADLNVYIYCEGVLPQEARDAE